MQWRILGALLFLLTATTEVDAGNWLFVSLLNEKKIVTFERDPETGNLTRRGESACPAEPACMAALPDRKLLFVSLRSTGQLASFHIEAGTGLLTPISVTDGGEDPAYLLPDRTGRFLLTAYYLANKVTVHAIGKDGSISTEPLQSVPTAEKAHGLVLDSTNRILFVPHTGANRIHQFHFDQQTGNLTASDPPFFSTQPEDHPRHISLHPSDRWAYVSNEAGDSLGVYAVDKTKGTLRHMQTLPTIPSGFNGDANATARCEMTPDGRFVYIANRGHDSIACFAIDQETGRARSLGQLPTEKTPRSFSIDPQGKFLHAAGQTSGRIAVYRIRQEGTLEPTGVYESGPVSWWALTVDTP